MVLSGLVHWLRFTVWGNIALIGTFTISIVTIVLSPPVQNFLADPAKITKLRMYSEYEEKLEFLHGLNVVPSDLNNFRGLGWPGPTFELILQNERKSPTFIRGISFTAKRTKYDLFGTGAPGGNCGSAVPTAVVLGAVLDSEKELQSGLIPWDHQLVENSIERYVFGVTHYDFAVEAIPEVFQIIEQPLTEIGQEEREKTLKNAKPVLDKLRWSNATYEFSMTLLIEEDSSIDLGTHEFSIDPISGCRFRGPLTQIGVTRFQNDSRDRE